MRTLFLHIGIGKTGSTAIQSYLHTNRLALLERDFLYPNTGVSGVVACAHHRLANYQAQTIPLETRALYEDLLTEIENSTAKNIIISSEQFCYAKPNYVAALSELFSGFDVKIVFFVRDQRSLLPSSYMQRLRAGDQRFVSFQDFFEKGTNAFKFCNRIKPWKETFPDSQFIYGVYDTEIMGPDVRQYFIELIGLHDLPPPEIGHNNNSLSPRLTPLVQWINRTVKKPRLRLKIMDQLERVSSVLPPHEYDRRLLKEIYEHYKQDNYDFANNYLSPEIAEKFLKTINRS